MSGQTGHISNTQKNTEPHNADFFFQEHVGTKTFKGTFLKYRIGIYTATIVAMLLIIFLLGYKISIIAIKPSSFSVLDLIDDRTILESEPIEETKRERLEAEVEELLQQTRMSQSASSRNTPSSVRNIAVNTQGQPTSALKDSKGINNSVYDEARQVQERMAANRKMAQELHTANDGIDISTQTSSSTSSSSSKEAYQGPTVLSYTLDGRNATRMPIPAYKCEEGGDVTVVIEVDPDGRVVGAEVDMANSSSNSNLHNMAIQAARMARFTASSTAPKKQQGIIVYRFIAQ